MTAEYDPNDDPDFVQLYIRMGEGYFDKNKTCFSLPIVVLFKNKDLLDPPAAFGNAYHGENYGVVLVIRILPKSVRAFVAEHEIYHLMDTHTWWGWIGSELRADWYGTRKQPFGFLLCLMMSIFSKERLLFYFDRHRNRY